MTILYNKKYFLLIHLNVNFSANFTDTKLDRFLQTLTKIQLLHFSI